MNPVSLFMTGISGESLLPEEKAFLIKEKPAGVILFKRNIKSFSQMFDLCKEIKSLDLLIGIDMEGGSVDRLIHLEGALPWPSAERMSRLKPDKIKKLGRALALHLQAFGIDINFAPVVDYNRCSSSLLKGRTFGQNHKEIITNARAWQQACSEVGVYSCLKHFPGHGTVSEDSHLVLPVSQASMQDLDIEPFEALISSPLIMTSHIQYPNIDQELVSLSYFFLEKTLRQKLKFNGVIVSDDIDMKALDSYSRPEVFLKTVKAGCNLILSCKDISTCLEIRNYFLSHASELQCLSSQIKSSKARIQALKKSPILSFKEAQAQAFSDEVTEALNF